MPWSIDHRAGIDVGRSLLMVWCASSRLASYSSTPGVRRSDYGNAPISRQWPDSFYRRGTFVRSASFVHELLDEYLEVTAGKWCRSSSRRSTGTGQRPQAGISEPDG